MDIQFISADRGYVLGVDSDANNILLKTTDGGANWEKISYTHRFLLDTADGVMDKISVSPFNPNILFSGRNTIIRSTDGGHHWERMDSATATLVPASRVSYHFLDDNQLICVGEKVYRSADAGFHWKTVYDPTGGFGFLEQIQFTSRETGYAAGGVAFDGTNYGFMIKTVDGGNSWQSVDYPLQKDITGLSFTDDLNGYLALNLYRGTIAGTLSTGCALYKTTDGGATWALVNGELSTGDNGIHGVVSQMYFRNGSEGFVASTLGIYHTLDGGKTWQVENVDPNSSYLFSFPNPHCGYAVDYNGKLFKRVSR